MTSTVAELPEEGLAARAAPYLTCLLILVALIDSQIVASLAPQIAAGLGSDTSTITTGITVYSVFAAAVALGLAWYPRAPAPRRWLPLAAAGFGVATIVTATAPVAAVFLAGRALAGFAAGLISALAIAALANASTYERRGSQMGLVAITYFLAPVLGVPLGTVLAGWTSWRVTFVLAAVAVAVAGLLVRAFPLPDRRESGVPAEPREPGARAALRYLWRLGTRSRSTRMGVVSAFFVSGGLVGFTSLLGVWLNDAFGAQPRSVGLVYATAGVGAVAGGAIGGRLADRFGKRRVAVAASAAMAALLPVVPALAWGPSLFAFVAVTAFVASLRVAPLQALITELVPHTERATYVALRNAASQLGIAATVALCARIYAGAGLMGVALVCALATLVAWVTSRRIDDPGGDDSAATPRRRPVVRLARAGAVVLVVLVVALPWMLSFLVTKAGTRPDERNRPDTPATYGATYEDVEFTSADGNQLSGWYLPSRATGVTIVMTHGLFRSRYELVERGCDLWKLGYGVLLYDLRRHGQSKAEFSTIGYMERHDVEAALAYVRARAPADRVVLYGVSMGAAATLLAAAESDGVAAVVADSSFLSLTHTVYHHIGLTRIPTYPFAPMLVWMTAARLNFMPSSFDVLAAVRRTDCPIMFIGGTKDVRMPVATVLDPLYDAAPNPLKRRLVVEGATHGHAYDEDHQAYVSAVTDFLQSALPASAAP